MFAFGLFGGSGGGGGSTTDLAGIANTAAASGQVLYGTTGGAAKSEAAFAYNESTDTLSVPVATATTRFHSSGTASNSVPMFSVNGATATAGLGLGTNSDTCLFHGGAVRASVYAGGITLAISNGAISFTSTTAYGGTVDCGMGRYGPNAVVFGAVASMNPGNATTRAEINKAVTGIADNTATATFTVTVPNGAHSANLEVTLKGSLGAGGAIGANEASASIKYNICIARTAGVNAVAVASAAYGSSGSVAVAGAATCTVTGTVSAISGAVGAANTFTVNVTIARGSGSSSNHTCFAYGVLINDNASGVTIA